MLRTNSLSVLIVTSSFVVLVETQFYQYHTKYPTNHGDHTCFYRYANELKGKARHLLPYCIRTSTTSQIESQLPCYGKNTTFATLKRSNVTGKQLMQWFAPIDLISDYQQFLFNGSGETNMFCNCSQDDRSFGTRCQYQLPVNQSSFNAFVDVIFSGKQDDPRDIRNLTEENDVTCYILSNCTTYTGFCLDWRQICDSKRDCVDGRDENRCLEKELNECDEQTEYRCLSGHCIPRAFSFDLTIDCPDWDDEQSSFTYAFERICSASTLAHCEERACTMSRYSCGDGQCIQDEIYTGVYIMCHNWRNALLIKRVYDLRPRLSDECWTDMICRLGLSCLYEPATVPNSLCQRRKEWYERTARFCKDRFIYFSSCPVDGEWFFPALSIVFPYAQILPEWKRLEVVEGKHRSYFVETMLCYNASACGSNPWPLSSSSQVVHEYECHNLSILLDTNYRTSWFHEAVGYASILLTTLQALFSHCFQSPSHSQLYQCRSGIQISRHRLMDGRVDCYLDKDDERHVGNLCTYNLTDRFECFSMLHNLSRGSITCKPRRLLKDYVKDCWGIEDELFPVGCTYEYDCQFLRDFDLSKPLPFVYEELCDGVKLRRESNVSEDETDCDAWPCQARAHRCDGMWNRPNGCDELNCPDLMSTYLSQIVANCSRDEHYCLHFNQSTLDCLPLARAGDGHIDCLFAMDERLMPDLQKWQLSGDVMAIIFSIRCWNSTKNIVKLDICSWWTKCPFNDDKLLCSWQSNSNCSFREFACKNGTCLSISKRCNKKIDCWPEAEDEWACDLHYQKILGSYRSFNFIGFTTEPHEKQIESSTPTIADHIQLKQKEFVILDPYFIFHCHRGLILRSKDGNDVCLCPPSYYGTRCQFQSERLSLTFRSEMPPIFDQNTVYHLIFVLHDAKHQVLSVETILHMPSRESVLKHLIYLIYPRHSNRPLNGDLFVHIEAYTVTTTEVGLVFLAWFYHVQFSFLPVNTLSFKLDLEPMPLNATLCYHLGCIHGQCSSYVNTRNKHFCSCYQGWTGLRCDQRLLIDPCAQLNCDTTYSKCLVHGDRAVCLCTLGRIGHSCRVPYDACNGIHCQNGGQCLSLDDRTLPWTCFCPHAYFGDFCQSKTAHLTIQIPQTASFIPAMVAHFLHTPVTLEGILSHRNTYFLKNIYPSTQITIQDRQQQFLPSIIILQTFVDLTSEYGSYYLLSLLDHNRNSLTKTIAFENRCVHVSERLNPTIMNFTWIKRVKLYHHYFKDVRCFFDEVYMCLVDNSQLIECLLFNHKVAHCTDRNYCENGGRCLGNKQAGQVQFACVCPECHYGLFCQLTMTQYSLTLDSMLGQEILTDMPLDQQKIFIKIILAVVVLIFVVGIASNICSTVTFYDIKIRSHGCGYYLFILSISSQISLIVFVCRFVYLLISQMTIIPNRQLLNVSCMLLDFLLQLSISFCDWLSSCVACERTVSVIKGVNFNKKLSVRMVKFVIPMLLISLILMFIHQVFSRELISDPRSNDRLWCVVKFPRRWLQTYNAVMNLFNSVVPFLINLISAILLLITFSRTKQKSAKKKYTTVFKKQVKAHKDLIISPIVMISFKLPMLIVILMIKCIKSQWELYLSTICYFLALVPLLATFAIFVLPAPSYVKVFNIKRTKLFKRL